MVVRVLLGEGVTVCVTVCVPVVVCVREGDEVSEGVWEAVEERDPLGLHDPVGVGLSDTVPDMEIDSDCDSLVVTDSEGDGEASRARGKATYGPVVILGSS